MTPDFPPLGQGGGFCAFTANGLSQLREIKMADDNVIERRRGPKASTEPYDVEFFAKKHGITLRVATCILSLKGRTRQQHDNAARKFKAGRWSLPSLNNSGR